MLISWVNLLGALPTLFAVFFVPRHFFRHVQTDGRKAIFLSIPPSKLILQSCALGGICAGVIGYRLTRSAELLIILVIALLSPLWMNCMIALFGGAAFIFSTTPFVFNLDVFELYSRVFTAFLLRTIGGVLPLKQSIRCIEYGILWRLNLNRYMWGCCYLSVSFLAVIMIALIPLLEALRLADPDLAAYLALPLAIVLMIAFSTRGIEAYEALVFSAAICPARRYLGAAHETEI
jgi:hypothetical protein